MERSVAIGAVVDGCDAGTVALDCVLVVPERPSAEQQEQREDREFRGRDALLSPIAVVPGEDQDDGQTDQECQERDLAELYRPLEGLGDVLQTLQESPGSGDVDQSPLDDLAAAQSAPGALGCTLCRRVGH